MEEIVVLSKAESENLVLIMLYSLLNQKPNSSLSLSWLPDLLLARLIKEKKKEEKVPIKGYVS